MCHTVVQLLVPNVVGGWGVDAGARRVRLGRLLLNTISGGVGNFKI